MVILLDVGLKVRCPTHIVSIVGTSDAADVRQDRSDMSYLNISEDHRWSYRTVGVSLLLRVLNIRNSD